MGSARHTLPIYYTPVYNVKVRNHRSITRLTHIHRVQARKLNPIAPTVFLAVLELGVPPPIRHTSGRAFPVTPCLIFAVRDEVAWIADEIPCT